MKTLLLCLLLLCAACERPSCYCQMTYAGELKVQYTTGDYAISKEKQETMISACNEFCNLLK